MFPLGLGYVHAAAHAAGYSVEIVNGSSIISACFPEDLERLSQELTQKLQKVETPMLIGIGPCTTTQIKAIKLIVECCKTALPDIPIICGGPLASIKDQEWVFFDFLETDAVVRGDGEHAIVEALHCIKDGKELCEARALLTANKRNGCFHEVDDLDLLPYPYRQLNTKASIRRDINGSAAITASMVACRGCLYNCSFCVSGNMGRKNFCERSYKSIIDEMEYLQDQCGVTDIIFYDDCFFHRLCSVNEDLQSFCAQLLQRGIKLDWQMEMRTDFLIKLSAASISLLQQARCRQINLGIEKTEKAALVKLNKLGPSGSQLKAAIKILKKEAPSIRVAGTFILGGPEETMDSILATIGESRDMLLDFAHYSPLFVYPGTPLYDSCFDNEKEWLYYIMKDDLPWGEIVYENEHISRQTLIELMCLAYFRFYGPKVPSELEAMVFDRFNLRRW